MRRATVAVLVVGVLWTAVGQAQRRLPPTSPFGYAVFSLGDVQLRDGVRAIDGDVGSNNGTANIGKNVRVAGSIVGRTIKLRQGARPDSLFCLLLQGSIAGLSCQAVGLPVVATNQLPPVQVIPGTQLVKVVPQGSSTSPIPAGAYGNARVSSRSTLMLAGGDYVFRSIRVRSQAQILCAGPCQIGVAETVTLQSNSVLGGTSGSGTRAEDIRVNIARKSRNTVFSAGQNSTVAAIVYAPGGRIELHRRGNFVGSFVGGQVKVDKAAIVQARSP